MAVDVVWLPIPGDACDQISAWAFGPLGACLLGVALAAILFADDDSELHQFPANGGVYHLGCAVLLASQLAWGCM